MGRTYTPISFFLDDISITAHSATAAEHLDVPVTVGDFANGDPVSLWKREENGDYMLKTVGFPLRFIEGPES